ncbi:MAG: 6-phosphogluconolactonase [Parvularculaceae bacterium]
MAGNGMTRPDCEIISFASQDAMAARIADLIAAQLQLGQYQNLMAEIAVSGGTTPRALYENLACRALEWEKIRVTLVDERWVGIDSPRSNEAAIRKAFAKATGVTIAGLYNNAETPQAGLVGCAAMFADRRQPFDVVVLGMGEDGHTASWFPHAEGLSDAIESDALICAIRAIKSDITGEEVDRMTLTLSAIRDAKMIVLLVTGQTKRTVLERALQPGPIDDMPVRAVFHARPDLWLCWAP